MKNTYPDVMNRLEGTISNMFAEFQNDECIVTGDVPPLLQANIETAKDALGAAILRAMDWQEVYLPRVIYEQTYAPCTDTTFIIKDTYELDNLSKREVVGFYSGEPNDEDLETYKALGTVAEY